VFNYTLGTSSTIASSTIASSTIASAFTCCPISYASIFM
jgi:hypothetical protein